MLFCIIFEKNENMKEEWKDIPNWEGKHQISNYGRVKTFNYMRTGKTFIREGTLVKSKGYMKISLKDKHRKEQYYVHRLVAELFIPNPNNYPQVNHKDEDKTNNCVSNLEYCDARYNSNYGTRNERISKAQTGEKHWNYGKHSSEQTKNKMRESHKSKRTY